MPLATLVVLPIIVLVLVQGGFPADVTCAVGVASSLAAGILWFRKPQRHAGIPVLPLVWLGLAVCYAASALASGLSLTTIAETGKWFACAGFAFLAATLDEERRSRAFWLLCYVGVATAGAGILLYGGLFSLDAGIVVERLQFTLQYANATAAWYGIIALLCLHSTDKTQRALAPLPLTAFLLTRSVGGTFAFIVACLVAGALWARRGAWERICALVGQLFLSVLMFLLIVWIDGPLALVPVLLLLGAYWALSDWLDRLIARLDVRKCALAVTVLCIVAIGVIAVLSTMRPTDFAASMHERAQQMHDALSLWLTRPLLGTGPNNWQYLYPYIQTSSYYATVVHSSFGQALTDAGAIGVLLLAVACVLGARGLIRELRAETPWSQAACASALLLGVHSLVEFDLQFSCLALLLAFLLASPMSAKVPENVPARGIAAGLLSIVLCVPTCAFGAYCALSATVVRASAATGDNTSCRQVFLANQFARTDPGAQSHYVEASYKAGDYKGACDVYRQMSAPTSQATLCAAMAYHELGDLHSQTATLVKALEARRHDKDLAENAERIGRAYGVDESLRERFEAAVTID